MTREGRPYGRRDSDQSEYCPRCRVAVEHGHMGSHMYHSHGEDRRKSREQQTPPPPEKKERRQTQTAPKDDGGGEGKTKSKESIWFRGRPS